MHVVPPGDMQFVLGTVEAEIGTTLELPLAMFGIIKKGTNRDCWSLIDSDGFTKKVTTPRFCRFRGKSEVC